MKLYWKKLNGFEELQREKIKLRYQRRHLDKLHGAEASGRNKEKTADRGLLHQVLNLAGGGDAASTAFEVGSMLIRMLGRKRRKKQVATYYTAEFPKPKSTGRKILDDIFWSYVVGKAVRVSAAILKDSFQKKKILLRK